MDLSQTPPRRPCPSPLSTPLGTNRGLLLRSMQALPVRSRQHSDAGARQMTRRGCLGCCDGPCC